MSDSGPTWQPTREQLLWLTGALVLVLAPHATRLPGWVSAAFLLLLAWRVADIFEHLRLPGRWLRLSLSVLGVAGVLATYGTVLGRDAGVALLVLLTSLKLMETNHRRDAFVLVFLGYFLVVTNFLYSTSIPMGLYMLVVVGILTVALVTVHADTPGLGPGPRMRLAGTLLLQALPLMVILFLLFPRISTPLWSLPRGGSTGASGLADTMSPGNISRLSLSDAVAFRVEFAGSVPPASRLYWRGPVLVQTDGRTWSGPVRRVHRRMTPPEQTGESVEYTLTLEPHNQRWLFALDLPGLLPPGARITSTYQLLSYRRVRHRFRYRGLSYPDGRIRSIGEERAVSLSLPDGAHPQARALAQQWREETADPAEVVRRALNLFRQEEFVYTRTPPVLTRDSVDEFLFDTRRGFCGHFASSFTVLMRAAGIPARVVTGYQGGELNPVGDYLIVRQRDAHAWVEVWLEGDGWLRVDPTAAVAPDRIEMGLDAAIPEAEGGGVITLPGGDTLQQAWRTARHVWDTLNNGWNQWVIGYGAERQRLLLGRLGFETPDWGRLSFALLVGVAGAMALLALWVLRRRPVRDPVTRAYHRFCGKLARRGLARRPHEGPVAFAERVVRRRPDLRAAVEEITTLYARCRYGTASGDAAALARAVSGFRPGPRATPVD